MPKREQDFEGTGRERLFSFRLQEQFDTRYVLKDGEYRLFRMLIVGFIGLLLTTAGTALLALIIHIPK